MLVAMTGAQLHTLASSKALLFFMARGSKPVGSIQKERQKLSCGVQKGKQAGE